MSRNGRRDPKLLRFEKRARRSAVEKVRKIGATPAHLAKSARQNRRKSILRIFAPFAAAAAFLLLTPLAIDLVLSLRTASPTCRVVLVLDGDTVKVSCPGEQIRSARLVGFDTPELYSPRCGSEAWAAIWATWKLRQSIWQADEVFIRRIGEDRYGRILARLSLDGADASNIMIKAGLARPYDGRARSGWC